MMRRSLAGRLLSPLQQTLQQSAAQCLSQVAALHSGQPDQQPVGLPGVQQPQQQKAPGRPHDYHAAALAEQPQWHDQQQHQQLQRHVEQLQRRHAAAQTPPQQHTLDAAAAAHTTAGLQQQLHAATGQTAALSRGDAPPNRHLPDIRTGNSSQSSLPHSTSSAGAAAERDVAPDMPGDEHQDSKESVFMLSSPEEQYRRTLVSLHHGHSKNLDQLAHMFNPQAVLEAPDRGAAILEAIMFAAAKLQDLQLLRQLLRCTAAAGNTLSSTGHRAVLHCLASCGRPVEALDWLQKRVPEQQLTPQLVRSLVQPLLKRRQVQAAQQALDYAEARLMQVWQQDMHTLQGGVQAAVGDSSEGEGEAPRMQLQDSLQELFALRLLVAGGTGQLAAVQEQWAAIQAQAAALQQQQQQQEGAAGQQSGQQDLLGVKVWAHYALALGRAAGRVGRDRDVEAAQVLQSTVWQVLDTYHASAWATYAEQQLAALQQGDPQDAAAVSRHQQWLVQRQQAAQRQWQHCRRRRGRMGWQQLDAAVVMPQEVAAAARFQERQFCRQAWHVTLSAAASMQDRQQVHGLLAVGSLLKFVPQGPDFEDLLQLNLRQGAPPEALEELFGEMMGWGVIPSVAAYEAVMEAHAQHRDLAAAEGVLDRMQAAGHQPVLRTYNRLLHGVALNGDLAAAIRVYNRQRLQGLQPDIQTMRALFKCVRLYASNVRVATARSISQANAGDREAIRIRLGQRAALFASAYSQLVLWQRDMVAAGLKHTPASLMNLAHALERLGADEDCLQLARLAEEARPGDPTAHRAALRAVGRTRDVRSAGEASRLLAQLASQGEPMARQDYLALISSQFWLNQDHEQLLQTVAAMQAAGYQLDQNVLQQLLHVYCHCGMWGEALQVLNDVAAGRFSSNGSGVGSSSSRPATAWGGQGVGAADGSIDNDQLWHVVLRKLWEKNASDELLNEFLKHMAPAQLQRFKLLYGLQLVPGQEGRYTVRPLEDWQVVLQPQQGEQQPQQGEQQPQQGEQQPQQGEQLLPGGDELLPGSEESPAQPASAPVYS